MIKLFFVLVLFCLPLFAAEPGPARATWDEPGLIVFKTPLSVLSDYKFVLKTSQQEIPLKFLKHLRQRRVSLGVSLSPEQIAKIISEDLRLVVLNNRDQVIDQTALQWAGLLDQLFADPQVNLGLRWNDSGSNGEIALWAPTAKRVDLLIYNSPEQDPQVPRTILPMRFNRGVWQSAVPSTLKNHWYLYRVEIYQPLEQGFKTYIVTDPYSMNLSLNGSKSQLIDINNPQLQPRDWKQLQKPGAVPFKDMVIYETHLRDVSSRDDQLQSRYRGTYMAFSYPGRTQNHFESLAQAGLTHIHLMPLADFATVNENKNVWRPFPLSFGDWGDSSHPQAELDKIKDLDSYNWGYDPVHWFVPEGSYASGLRPESRVLEFRQMVSDLNRMGLRVIMDVVYNHTYADGNEVFSVLDKIVPFYYYRYDEEGRSLSSSCCPDTASENLMMEKLMIDSVLHWAKVYKVDGFRFDLMSFHSTRTMNKIKERLRALTPSRDQVDGRQIYIYGEAWPFGSFYEKAPDQAMTQENSYGLEIGTFNDRMRDALRGGTTDSREKSDQGFLTGLYYDFNQEPANRNTPIRLDEQKEKLLELKDVIQVGLAGNLRDFIFRNRFGQSISGGELLYRGQVTAYARSASETINYISAHDGYSLWDAIQAKAPFRTPGRGTSSPQEKTRMQWLGLGAVLLSQGVAFIEGGSEILRSKSGDVDSYNSGDWFNALPLDLNSNNWSAGRPPYWRNGGDWSFWSPRLQDPAMKVSGDLIAATKNYFEALLQLRARLSPWRIETAAEANSRMEFLRDERQVFPALIVLLMKHEKGSKLLIINASNTSVSFAHPILSGNWAVAPELMDVDPLQTRVLIRNSGNEASAEIPARTLTLLEKTSSRP